MPLPAPMSPWPPPGVVRATNDRTAWSAWWSGDPDALSTVYGGSQGTVEQSWVRRTGVVGAIQRWFWGQQTQPGDQRTKLHVPLAGEIPQVSADLLFAAPPAITVEDKATQEAIDRLMGEDVHVQLYDAAESCSALGHTFLRTSFDREVVPDAPILSVVDADAAFPRFRYGRLTEVTFLTEWVDGGSFFRHLQHHSCAGGIGLVEHALYLGTAHNLGKSVPLAAHPGTEIMGDSIVALSDGRQGVLTGLSRIDVVAIPNARTKTWRHLPEAKDLGSADIAGCEPVLDALDDAWSSWMRDLRHGRSRLHVPQQYLRSNGPGKGATADIDQEIYVGFNTMVDASGQGGLQIDAQQFAIRYAEHAATVEALIERIVSGAGYSPQTFGLADTSALTATESWARQIRTQNTRAAKIRRWRIGLREVTRLMVELDRVQFAGKGDPLQIPAVQFQESVAESQKARAETASLLAAAKAASTETLVRMQHPDWDDAQVLAEVGKIKDMEPAVVSPMAAAFGGDSGPDGDPDDPANDPAGDGGDGGGAFGGE